ncbi:Uncharacterised protein [Mycobacteroides abscessus subsp. abscessus]|nr:Uncharacterised protein [Mycobacteroides abscessus subsp. abscessus]SIJ08196.1 Uncharacterised protein [Mycobacteroides abscessus subsp. bolletii]SHT23202.1 Uncharacterised protein [Mycobacteroides abscessus subsp. abscessus]SHT64088.1 Uncharacterised protein [Mycobacteroides abscessus subsp. abscessus]SHU78178.1 Uncharacterised protein [Mycobacteroides abscessus subsp. abscessus]
MNPVPVGRKERGMGHGEVRVETASGHPGYLDGAMEAGTRAALEVTNALRG